MNTDVERRPDGTFLEGTSGNPAGRPKGRKNALTVLKQDLELAVRSQITPEDISRVVNTMIGMALDGNVGAAKLILDKVISNSREIEDEKETQGGLRIVIENATFGELQQKVKPIDSTCEEVK